MSPASYQTAPPRTRMLPTRLKRAKGESGEEGAEPNAAPVRGAPAPNPSAPARDSFSAGQAGKQGVGPDQAR